MRLRMAAILSIFLLNSLGWLFLPQAAHAATNDVVISELRVAGAGGSDEEFVELYNQSDNDQSLEGWLLQYRSASAGADCTKKWTSKVTLTGTIKAHGFYLLAAKGYVEGADNYFAPGLAASAGTIRMLDRVNTEVTALAWGANTPCGQGQPAASPGSGSLVRVGNEQFNNETNYSVVGTPQPQTSDAPAQEQLETPEPVTVAPEDEQGMLELSELFIDPAAPQTDAADEFIELHNAGTTEINLTNYSLEIGRTTYHLPAQALAGDQYLAIQADESPLSLTNSGGTVTLRNAAGATVDTTTWPAAVAGASWIKGETQWAWTTKPTPDAVNELALPAGKSSSTPGSGVLGAGAPGSMIEITEVLPDPASPATDAADEFIELYNAGDAAVDLEGYTLKTGTTLNDSYHLPQVTLEAGEYLEITSAQSKLTLSNAGSHVALFDPSDQRVGAEVIYGAAKSGQAWAKFPSGWSWTYAPTPGTANVMAETTTVAAAAKKAAATKKSAAKATKAKASKAKAAKTPAAKSQPMIADAKTPDARWLLFALAALTIGYIIYEFRHDLRSFYHRLRGYTGRGGKTSQAPEGE